MYDKAEHARLIAVGPARRSREQQKRFEELTMMSRKARAIKAVHEAASKQLKTLTVEG